MAGVQGVAARRERGLAGRGDGEGAGHRDGGKGRARRDRVVALGPDHGDLAALGARQQDPAGRSEHVGGEFAADRVESGGPDHLVGHGDGVADLWGRVVDGDPRGGRPVRGREPGLLGRRAVGREVHLARGCLPLGRGGCAQRAPGRGRQQGHAHGRRPSPLPRPCSHCPPLKFPRARARRRGPFTSGGREKSMRGSGSN